jgi:hypothetical protein
MIAKWKRARTAGAMVLLLPLCFLTLPGLAAPWVQTTSFPHPAGYGQPEGFAEHSMVYASGYLYHAGGFGDFNGDSASVFYSQVQSNGTIGAWNVTTPLPAKILDHAGVAANGFVNVLGGFHYTDASGYTITNAVYYSKINSNASLGTWQTASPLPQPMMFHSAAVSNNRIYAIGGWNEQTQSLISNVYSAIIQSDGSLSAWVTQRSLPDAIFTHASVANGMLYVLGGVISGGGQSKVYYAEINPDGTLGDWRQTTPLPSPLFNLGAVAANGRVFVMGGSDTAGPTRGFYSAPVAGDGSLGSWSAGPILPIAVRLHAVAVTDSYIVLSGGYSDVQTESAVYSMALPLPPAAPAMVSGSFTNGNFQLGLAAQTNTGFGLLASTNLTDWQRIAAGFTGTNGVLFLQDTNAASFPRRFYRAYWPLP